MTNISTPPLNGEAEDPQQDIMAAYRRLNDAEKDGAAILAGIAAADLTVEEIIADGKSALRAQELKRAADLFFGSTRKKKLQKLNHQLIFEKQFLVDVLTIVAQAMQYLFSGSTNPVHHPQSVLHEILTNATGLAPEIEQQATQIVRAHNEAIREERQAEIRAAQEEGDRLLAEKKRRDQHRQELREDDEDDGFDDDSDDDLELPEVPAAIDTPKGRVYIIRKTNAAGERTIVIKGPEGEISAFALKIERLAQKLRKNHPELELVEALYLVMTGTDPETADSSVSTEITTDEAVVEEELDAPRADSETDKPKGSSNQINNDEPVLRLTVTMGSDDYQEFKKDEPSVEFLNASFGCSDGTIRTGRELRSQKISRNRTFIKLDWENQDAEVFITRPHLARDDTEAELEETLTRIWAPLDMGTTARAPNALLRKILDALYLQCVWPGCSKPGALSDYHHIIAAQNGGPTSLWNLTKLCPHHNGRNDDDRDRPRNGYVFLDDGVVKFQLPNDSTPITLADPILSLGALAISRSRKLPSLQDTLEVPVPSACSEIGQPDSVFVPGEDSSS